MSVEKAILSKIQESRRLYESWPPVLNKLGKYHKDVVRNKLIQSGIDIEHTPYKAINITSGRDPRLKGDGVVIFVFSNGNTAVWFKNKFIVDTYVSAVQNDASRMSWKNILEHATRIIYMEFDMQKSKDLKQKRQDRKEAQQGVINRYTKKNAPRYAKLDKSGYIIDPQKYQRMFAELNIKNADKILAQAKDLYVKSSMNIDKIDFSNYREADAYDNAVRAIMRSFRDLTNDLKLYNNTPEESFDNDWAHQRVVSSIKVMKDAMNDLKKFI